MHYKKIKQFFLLLGLLIPAVWCGAAAIQLTDGQDHIIIKESHVQSVPKGSSIQASIDGHNLTVVFTENLGQVVVEVTTDGGVEVDVFALYTPNGVIFYIPDTGSYIVTFTLSNGDVYYGEFEVTDD